MKRQWIQMERNARQRWKLNETFYPIHTQNKNGEAPLDSKTDCAIHTYVKINILSETSWKLQSKEKKTDEFQNKTKHVTHRWR